MNDDQHDTSTGPERVRPIILTDKEVGALNSQVRDGRAVASSLPEWDLLPDNAVMQRRLR